MARSAVIAGVGASDYGKVPDKSPFHLMSQATKAALDDAGLRMSDIDGLITTPMRVGPLNPPALIVARNLGISTSWLSTVDLAGASGTAMLDQAAMAVASGQCTTVLCVSGQNLLSNTWKGSAIQAMAESGVAHQQFEVPQGPLVVSLYALVASQHMARYGTTEEQMAEVAVAIRAHAALNPKAQKREPITIQDVMASKRISSPLKMLDCALVSDGAVAFIVTSADRAVELRKRPVKILGIGYGHRHGYVGETRDLVVTGAIDSGARAFREARLGPGDIDVAEIYDCFTITVLCELEDLGFCPKGEAGRFVEDGRLRPKGAFPITTHGGLLSCMHSGLSGGMMHVVEGVRQIRGEAGAAQVPGVETALVHGNGGVIAIHCTAILGAEHTA